MPAPLYPPSPVRYYSISVSVPIITWDESPFRANAVNVIEKAINDAMAANLGTTRIYDGYVYKITGFRQPDRFSAYLIAIAELQGPYIENKP